MAPPPRPHPEDLLLHYAERHNILRSDAEYMLRLMAEARAETRAAAVLAERDQCLQEAKYYAANSATARNIVKAIRGRPAP
jgi:hypothetical protein